MTALNHPSPSSALGHPLVRPRTPPRDTARRWNRCSATRRNYTRDLPERPPSPSADAADAGEVGGSRGDCGRVDELDCRSACGPFRPGAATARKTPTQPVCSKSALMVWRSLASTHCACTMRPGIELGIRAAVELRPLLLRPSAPAHHGERPCQRYTTLSFSSPLRLSWSRPARCRK